MSEMCKSAKRHSRGVFRQRIDQSFEFVENVYYLDDAEGARGCN